MWLVPEGLERDLLAFCIDQDVRQHHLGCGRFGSERSGLGEGAGGPGEEEEAEEAERVHGGFQFGCGGVKVGRTALMNLSPRRPFVDCGGHVSRIPQWHAGLVYRF